MTEQYSSVNQSFKKPESVVEEQTGRRTKPPPFYKSSTISFVKVGICHMCKFRNKIVYQCHKNYQATSCEKKFCLDCLVLIYKDNIIENLQKNQAWKCPYIKKICRCKNCCQSRKEAYSVLQIDMNMSIYSNLRMKAKQPQQMISQQISNLSVNNNSNSGTTSHFQPNTTSQMEQKNNQSDSQNNQSAGDIDESMRCLIRERFKRVIQFNGQMINKVNANYHKLTEEEIKFYNKLIYSNLKVMNNIANNMVAHQSLVEQ